MNYKNIFKRETKVIAYVVFALTLIVIGSSYALFLQVDNNTNHQIVTAGSLVIDYGDSGAKINANENNESNCLTPRSDSNANRGGGCNYTLSITNDGTLPMEYNLLIYDQDNGEKLVDHSLIKHSVKKQLTGENAKLETVRSGVTLNNLNPLNEDEADKLLLDKGTINPGDTIVYSLKIWISDAAEETIAGEHVSLKLDVSGVVYEDENNSLS